jgi:hypothetical protein
LPAEVAEYLVALGLASRTSREGLLDDFMAGTLRILGFNEKNRTVITHFTIPIDMCGFGKHAKTNVCVINGETGMILFIIKNKTMWDISANPEPRIIAGAITIFQYNNRKHAAKNWPPVDRMIIPAITMHDTCPTFYLIPISQQLSNAVKNGNKPIEET